MGSNQFHVMCFVLTTPTLYQWMSLTLSLSLYLPLTLQLHEGVWPQPGVSGAVLLPLPDGGMPGGHLPDLPGAAGAQSVLL